MAVANLSNDKSEIISGIDNVVIVDNFQSVRGGRTLDVEGFPDSAIRAGHVIIKDAKGEYKPMPLDKDGKGYGALPEGSEYAGILIASIPKVKPFAGIMVRGTVNTKAAPFKMDAILDAVKAALPLIIFTED